MKLTEHLLELRYRFMVSLGCIALCFVGVFVFAQELYALASLPIRTFLPPDTSMIATEVTSTFFAPLKLSFFAAFALAMPITLFQAWRFVAPGLYRNERSLALPLLVMSVVLFYLGMAFAYTIVFPHHRPILFWFYVGGGHRCPGYKLLSELFFSKSCWRLA